VVGEVKEKQPPRRRHRVVQKSRCWSKERFWIKDELVVWFCRQGETVAVRVVREAVIVTAALGVTIVTRIDNTGKSLFMFLIITRLVTDHRVVIDIITSRTNAPVIH